MCGKCQINSVATFVKRFPILEDIKATAENVANVYVDEIVESLK